MHPMTTSKTFCVARLSIAQESSCTVAWKSMRIRHPMFSRSWHHEQSCRMWTIRML